MRIAIMLLFVLTLNNLREANAVTEEQAKIGQIVEDVIVGKKIIRPSIVPPDVADRLHGLDEEERQFLHHMGNIDNDCKRIAEFCYMEGQCQGIMSILLALNILSKEDKWFIEFVDHVRREQEGFDLSRETSRLLLRPSRLRALATMLLLMNYKELEPVPPSNIVQLAIPGK